MDGRGRSWTTIQQLLLTLSNALKIGMLPNTCWWTLIGRKPSRSNVAPFASSMIDIALQRATCLANSTFIYPKRLDKGSPNPGWIRSTVTVPYSWAMVMARISNDLKRMDLLAVWPRHRRALIKATPRPLETACLKGGDCQTGPNVLTSQQTSSRGICPRQWLSQWRLKCETKWFD